MTFTLKEKLAIDRDYCGKYHQPNKIAGEALAEIERLEAEVGLLSRALEDLAQELAPGPNLPDTGRPQRDGFTRMNPQKEDADEHL